MPLLLPPPEVMLASNRRIKVMKVQIDEEILAGMRIALIAYKFKLCEPPRHDGRQDVWLAKVANRDAQLECVKQLLEDTKNLTNVKASAAILKAFS
jgi:hypothetical protein